MVGDVSEGVAIGVVLVLAAIGLCTVVRWAGRKIDQHDIERRREHVRRVTGGR
jgi:flagellar basal body-associated protein FliL